MSVTKCILGKADSGLIDKEFAESQVKKIEKMEKEWREGGTPPNTMEKRLVDFANQLKHDADVKKLQLLREVQTQNNLRQWISQNRKGKIEGLKSTLTYDLRGDNQGLNIDKLSEAIRAESFGNMQDITTRLSLHGLGFKQDKDLAKDVVKAIFGDTSNEKAVKLAKEFNDTMESLRRRFNNAGGDYPFLKDYHLPQSHDSRLLNQVSEDEWVKFVRPLIDKNKMINFDTGCVMSEAKLDEVLRESYETLRTMGLNKMVAGKNGKGSLANKYKNERRILHFKDADSWLKYNEKFGNDDIYKTMVDYVDDMSRDIAFLEIYGPNPDKTKRLMVDELTKEAGSNRDVKVKNKAQKQLAQFEILWEDATGAAAVPADPRAAKIGSEVRSLLTSAQLGSAFLTQMSDIAVNSMTAKFNGLPRTELWKNYARLMFDKSNKYRDFSIHLGLGAEEVVKTLSSASRYAEGFLEEKGIGHKCSHLVMKWSLMDRMTMASKKAFGLDFLKALADSSDVKFDQLNEGFKRAFKRYGIEAKDWDAVRISKFDSIGGAKYLNLRTLANENLDVARKFQNMIFTERDFAVIDSNMRTRAFMSGGSKAGSFWGEARRYFAMYKTFPITMLTHHLTRMINLDTATSKAGYAVSLFVPMTVMGAITVQAKNAVNGKKMQDMDNWKFWTAAAMAGGAAGILGDFLFAEESRTGNSLIATAVGPIGSLAEDAWKISGGAIKKKLTGQKVNYSQDVIDTIRRYTPGNNLWLTKIAMERMLWDQASLAFNSEAKARYRRLEKMLKKDYNNSYWWRPGHTLPNFWNNKE